jgi:hypothetical protein
VLDCRFPEFCGAAGHGPGGVIRHEILLQFAATLRNRLWAITHGEIYINSVAVYCTVFHIVLHIWNPGWNPEPC